MKEPKKLTDISTVEGQMIEYDLNDIPDLPLDVAKLPFKKYSEKDLADTCLDTLDGVSVLNIPRPKTPAEEEELVNKFLSGLRKLFDKEDNWLFCNMLEADMDCCAQCNSCSAACHLYEMSGENEMYRPNFRSEILRRIYHQYIKKEPLAKWRYGDFPLNWKTVVRLGELSYRCNLCRRCAQVCPIGVDNGMIAREIRKIFSQEMGFAPKELHAKGTELQMQRGSSTGMTPDVVKDNVEFIDEDYSEITGVGLETPFDKKGADILLIHNAGEIMAWPENVAAFTTIFNAAGLSWTLSSKMCGYDGVNYGVFYDDTQTARIAIQHMAAAKELGVKKIVIGECGHAHKALTVIADRAVPYDMQVPRESCYVTLNEIIKSGRIKLDPSRNNFPVTLHDPCNVVRLMGIVEPQREILRAIAPSTLCASPNLLPAALKRRSISVIVASPIPSCERCVESPRERKNSSLAAIVRSIRSSSEPPVIPQIRSPYCRSLPRFCSRSTRNVPLMTMASVAPCVSPCSAVSSCPIICVAQSCATPMRIMSFSARVAASIYSDITA